MQYMYIPAGIPTPKHLPPDSELRKRDNGGRIRGGGGGGGGVEGRGEEEPSHLYPDSCQPLQERGS